MALSGLHAACGSIGVRAEASLLTNVAWSQTMAAAGTTSQAATSGANTFEVYSSADVYVAIGPNPNATTGPRIFVPANTTRNLFAQAGDYLAWVAA